MAFLPFLPYIQQLIKLFSTESSAWRDGRASKSVYARALIADCVSDPLFYSGLQEGAVNSSHVSVCLGLTGDFV